MKNLKGKIAIVTGGSQGYGKATAKLLAEDGATVIIVARNQEKLVSAKAEIKCADYFSMDVTCSDEWDKLYKYIADKYGWVDILINNAGGGIAIKDTIDQTIEDIDSTIELNLNSVIYGSRVFGKMMKTQKQGTIINIASACAKQAWPQWSVYAAAKWGVLGFSKGLYVELQPYSVRVTCLIPGAGATDFRQKCGLDSAPAKLQAEDVGNAILDICKLPEHVVVEEMIVWGIDQAVVPL